jgi:aspartate/methionine/tyrosine aminotransferase
VRAAIAAYHGLGLGGADLILTASTSEAYSWLFKLLCDPGDDILVPSPSYPLFHWLAALEGVAARSVPALRHERWNLDLPGLEAACGPRTRAVVVVNPNNPTGHFLDRGEWAALLAFCARRGLALLVDEVFGDYALEPPAGHLPTALECEAPGCPLFVLSGLSKIAALPQIKLGWIAARGAQARALLEPLSFIADQYLSVSASAQAAAPELLRLAPAIQTGIKARLRANLAALDRALAPHPHLSRLPVEGGWSVLLRRPALDPAEACALRLLREAQVYVHPGHFFDLPGEGYLVLSLLPRAELFQEGVQRMVAALA